MLGMGLGLMAEGCNRGGDVLARENHFLVPPRFLRSARKRCSCGRSSSKKNYMRVPKEKPCGIQTVDISSWGRGSKMVLSLHLSPAAGGGGDQAGWSSGGGVEKLHKLQQVTWFSSSASGAVSH